MADKDTRTENAGEEEEPKLTVAGRLEKAASSGMRSHLRKTGGAPTLGASMSTPTNMVQTALAQHDDHAREPSPMAMLAGKTRLAAAVTSHVKQVGTRTFSESYLTGREDAKARMANTVRIPKADLANPATVEQLKRDLAHLAANPKTALDPKKPMGADAIDRKVDVAMRWPGNEATFLMDNMGLARNPELAATLSQYAHGGREKLVEAGLLPPLERDQRQGRGQDAEGRRAGAPAIADARQGNPADDAMAHGERFRRLAPPRPPRIAAPSRGGHEL